MIYIQMLRVRIELRAVECGFAAVLRRCGMSSARGVGAEGIDPSESCDCADVGLSPKSKDGAWHTHTHILHAVVQKRTSNDQSQVRARCTVHVEAGT
jgi:hypothetical protein